MSTVTTVMSNKPEELVRAQTLLEEFAEASELPGDVVFALNVVLDEIVSNILKFAYPEPAEGEIRLRLTAADDRVEMEIEDDGPAFDPLGLPPPDVGASLAERQVGGLGVHLVRRLMTDVAYERDGDINRLRLRKVWSGTART